MIKNFCASFSSKVFLCFFVIFSLNNILLAEEQSRSKSQENNLSEKTIVVDSKRIINLENLKSTDSMFKEYSYIVADNYKLISAGKIPDMIFFKYKPGKDDTLISIASRCCLNYDTIASLNGIANSSEKLYGKTLILPTVKGLFIKQEKADNSMEILLRESFLSDDKVNHCKSYKIMGESFLFIQNEIFTPTQRAYFLDSSLTLPLEKDSFWVSSEFGKRKNPFSGKWKNHNGIDLAAPENTPVYAIKNGTVEYCFYNDETFGNYIILSHDNDNMTSVYAHLSKITVQQNKTVKRGEIIGYVGQTGMATGPHLHFEIRQQGVPQNPQSKLKL